MSKTKKKTTIWSNLWWSLDHTTTNQDIHENDVKNQNPENDVKNKNFKIWTSTPAVTPNPGKV